MFFLAFFAEVIYDLTYQKGLRLSTVLTIFVRKFGYLRPDISKGITTDCEHHRQDILDFVIYDLTYQKGLRRFAFKTHRCASFRVIYDLTYQKGLRHEDQLKESRTFHFVIYDLTYQKGLRRPPMPASLSCALQLSTT